MNLEDSEACAGLAAAERTAKVVELYRGISEADRTTTIRDLCGMFTHLNVNTDLDVLKLAVHVQFLVSAGEAHEAYIQKTLPVAINRMCSNAAKFTAGNGLQRVGAVFWVVFALFPRKLQILFPKYLSFCNDASVIDEESIKGWVALSGPRILTETLSNIGAHTVFTDVQVEDVKKSKGIVDLLAYLDLEEEEDDDEEGDEEEDDE
jgi:hypothetical protein